MLSTAYLREFLHTVDRIDDYFEYRYISSVDRDFVLNELNQLTNRLDNLKREENHDEQTIQK